MNRISDILNWTVFSVGDTATSLRGLVAAVAVLILTHLLSKVVRSAVKRKASQIDDDSGSNRVYGIIAVLVVWLIGIDVAFELLGFSLTSLLAASGFLALGAGFAVKNIVENFLSGGILRMERTIGPGDIIIVNEKHVVVRKIALRTTRADTFDGEQILIPNSLVAQSMVTNMTRRDRLFRIHVGVGVAYESDLNLVRSVLEKAISELNWISSEIEPAVFLDEFGDSSINYSIAVWIDDVSNSRQRGSDLHEAIWQALKDNEIIVAFPQLDVHLDGPART